ncbi:hypothetical protein NIES2135_58110 [Leptolyngbya boryana NIES-2135]|jgi:hypothetical protein|uniref:Uncharacterized protein n=1 Tax=Leptolyngbya boryana NIES-2135 TaxID=1973484 RepID=A0A1Z4JQD0_LEPBY|nr:hypothetical protein [Leptolyngbya boryana]ULP29987.1 hypothetical protein MCP04_28835 [Leptolyngbya boryana IU 594]BAS54924.1 hypothetical protein LBWT_8240 [Leptolyngbya boryana IAM M-101]BAS61272.1 hypothetical protein LBDG_08240 [Leptolyngbya boryana dg5]BAY58936.1 hypothetical protein NIES2135_58110 [Leptolyngbya boryana NIES-2135]
MPLPNNFSPAEHLQDTIRRTYNPEVREWFSDITTDDPDINTPRASLRTACTHAEMDTMDMTLSRMLLFDMLIKQRWNQGIVSGDRDLNYRVLRRTRPQVTLYFLEDLEDVEPGYDPVSGEISFRLMTQTSTTFSNSEALALANKIKTEFGTGQGFVWRKGKELCSYTDWDKGYQLQLLVRSEAEARTLIGKVLDLQSHTPDWEFFNRIENGSPSEAFPTIPPRETILGKSRRLPRRRPIAEVRFQYATVKLAGLAKPVYLFDRSGRYDSALVPSYRT